MRVLIISDSHGRHENLREVIRRVRPDRLIHCGDILTCQPQVQAMSDCPLDVVRGNNDFGTDLPNDLVLSLGRHRLYVTHGHHEHVSWGLEDLAIVAAAHKCDYAVFGHTHYPTMECVNGVTLINPGSISLPRQPGRKPSFIVCDVDKNGDLHFAQNYL